MQFVLSILEILNQYVGGLSLPQIDGSNFSIDLSGIFPTSGESSGTAVIGPAIDWINNIVHSLASDSIVSAPVLLLAAGVTIFLGVSGEAFFKKTGIPDVAFLMILGVVIGPVLGLIQPDVVIEIVPYFAAIALIIIMFDGGLNLDLKSMAKTAHFAVILSVVGFAISVGIVAALAHFGFGWEWLDSILLGSIVGGSSSAIVFGLVRNLKISDKAKSLLSFESALTDILATIVAFVMFGAIVVGTLDMQTLGDTIGSSIAVGLVLGLGVGLPWMYLSSKFMKGQHVYMLTLGILFVLYFFANHYGESGALTALVFGLMVGNKHRFAKLFRFKMPHIDTNDSMHNQLTFLVRTFFFVFVGLLASFGNIEYVIFGIIATVAIYIGRVILSKMTLTNSFSKLDKKVTTIMIPRGLAAAVLATFPLTMGLPNAEAYPQIVFTIIMASVIITTLGLGGAKKIPPPEYTEGGFVVREQPKTAIS
ncbi:MAG: peptidase [Crenarchaeota archaeon]|nr:MAG: peptidase [Thermoproteota archaeon]RDJ33211.1 MAG: peptidase [Thermoproteota archaeon]RDJ36286.1 MAG: peptidase [Thermoproteota archaeon]RDJ38915.1 MAG: peptidase [Thermoproteota archaeon]